MGLQEATFEEGGETPSCLVGVEKDWYQPEKNPKIGFKTDGLGLGLMPHILVVFDRHYNW